MQKKQSIIIQKDYPFGSININDPTKHYVKKKLIRGQGQLQKTKILSQLKHENLIKIQGVQQQNGEYFIIYQYIPMCLQKWYVKVSRQYIQNYQQRLILLSRYLTDKGIIITFRQQNMGVTDIGQPKYFLDTSFNHNLSIDKLAQKKKYKEEIRQLIQYYLDKNTTSLMNNKKNMNIPQKKQNSKINKILQAIQKGKADLCTKQTGLANNRNKMTQIKSPSNKIQLKPSQNRLQVKSPTNKMANFQNVFIKNQVNHINKIQVIIGNNKPIQVIQQQFKRSFATSSFYLNGIQAAKFQNQSQTRRLLSPSDKYNKFSQVNFKEYKNIKASGQKYVQDFISVLEAQQNQKNRLTMEARLSMNSSPFINLNNIINKKMIQQKNIIEKISQNEQIKQALNRQQKRYSGKNQTKLDHKSLTNIEDTKIYTKDQKGLNTIDEKSIELNTSIMNTTSNKKNPSEIKNKINQAIANSLNAINKIKNGKTTQIST